MGLEKVKEEILDKANKTAEKIKRSANKEAEDIKKRSEEEISELKSGLKKELKKIENTIKKKELASSELEIKKMLLQEKKNAIEKVFSEAEKKLEGLDSKKREIHIIKLLSKVKDEVDVKYIFCNKKDKEFVKGYKIEDSDILGGIIAENEERNVRVDYSYDTLLEGMKEKHLQDLGKILFG